MEPSIIQVLLIEDNLGDARLLELFLKDASHSVHNAISFVLTHAETLQDGLEEISRQQFDVILLDLSLPDSHGLDTFTHLHQVAPKAPTILLTGNNDELLAMQAMKQGAQDYLIKGEIGSDGLLVRAIRYAIERQRLVSELEEKALALQERNEDLDAFSHMMAHQVRSPLSQILGYADYIRTTYQKELNIDIIDLLKRIVQAGYKMNNILSELLLLSSVRNQREVDSTPLNMTIAVYEAQKRLRFQIQEKQAIINSPNTWPVAVGHGPWIEEVWVNYISNALKYGGSPPVLELGANLTENHMIRFWIKDNGDGIDDADYERIFEPHIRLENNQKADGEGVGLSIVQRIIYKCGGNVGVSSTKGAGSLFWFTLPAWLDESYDLTH